MSRTKKGSKGSGYEYWGRRPAKVRYPDPGRETKKITHRQERAAKKRDLLKEERDPE
ncbi:MAG: hypothetical protein ABFC88_12415 [Thermoguttaceae bacterium]